MATQEISLRILPAKQNVRNSTQVPSTLRSGVAVLKERGHHMEPRNQPMDDLPLTRTTPRTQRVRDSDGLDIVHTYMT
jgi:hypothetical protein